MIVVSGVRRSWETARSRLARILSFSASASLRSFSSQYYLLLFYTGGGCAGDNTDCQHTQKCDRVAVQGKIHPEKGIGKKYINRCYAENRSTAFHKCQPSVLSAIRMSARI